MKPDYSMQWESKTLGDYISSLDLSGTTLDPARKARLEEIAAYISKELREGKDPALVFICTHNSRRSQMAMAWGQVAASYFGLDSIRCFSGGTEVTAFHPNAVEALARAGLGVEQAGSGSNPVYLLNYARGKPPVRAFSKAFSDPFNPQKGFIALMTCTDAEEACPVVSGAGRRFSIPYRDPKLSDGSADCMQVYDERCRQIAEEMFLVMQKVQ